MKKMAVRFNIRDVNAASDEISKYANVDRSKVIRAALNLGLEALSIQSALLNADDIFLMVHKNQELSYEPNDKVKG